LREKHDKNQIENYDRANNDSRPAQRFHSNEDTLVSNERMPKSGHYTL
jgi:hypothetical protein